MEAGAQRQSAVRAISAWLGSNRLGLAVMALVVGAGAGLGAAGFRELVFFVTWLATGHSQFGQQGHAPSLHLPFLGIWFVLVVPVLGGLLYGPLIQRFAREARGHGVPEVMLAVAENGGRIRPPVTIVKALASAITIGSGGSVGREGPIVQIGSALASTLGQWVRMSSTACGSSSPVAPPVESRRRSTPRSPGCSSALRSCCASSRSTHCSRRASPLSPVMSSAAPCSARRRSSAQSRTTSLSRMTPATCSSACLLSWPGSSGWPLRPCFMGWRTGRTNVARPAGVGSPGGRGRPPGIVLLALPQMYGVGYPVMDSVIAGHVVVGLILLFLVGKIVAASLTLSIGGSGGVFAPSLFIGTMAGMAFGVAAHHLFGPAIGPPAMYAVVAMGGVFAGAAQAPLTAIASVVEMTGNFTLTLPSCSPRASRPRCPSNSHTAACTRPSCCAAGSISSARDPTTCSRHSGSLTSCSRSTPATRCRA